LTGRRVNASALAGGRASVECGFRPDGARSTDLDSCVRHC